MLDWTRLLSEARRKETQDTVGEETGTKGNRTEHERDFDRILFSTPTRRLADKTQVFPLDPSDSVRTRLTHSYEVSNLARSIGMSLSFNYPEQVFGFNHEELLVKRKVPAMLAASGLAHDLGNPPFGHQGEYAVSDWFKQFEEKSELEIHQDFINFDGNPHTFRLLTKLQILNDDYGLNLTYGTLAALVKYPTLYDSKIKDGYEKFGIFESERKVFEDVCQMTGLSIGIRHPFAHIMEACDDIAYSVLDAEDTVKKGLASFYDLIDHLETTKDGDGVIQKVIEDSKKKNKDYKSAGLSSYELNEISMQMFRVFAISELIKAATQSFVDNIKQILRCEIEPNFELIKQSSGHKLCKTLKAFDKRYGFKNKQVLELELEGQNYINSTMGMIWDAITGQKSPFSKYAYAMLSENYRRVYERSNMPDVYKNCQLLCDSISGMTDSYLIAFHNKLRPLYNGLS